MAKLIELKEAAEQLGITPEALTEMVDQKKIFGYRDGASWKFKPSEIERLAGEIGTGGIVDAAKDALEGAAESLGLGGGTDEDDLIDVDELQLDDDTDNGADSILISEEELGRSEDSTSSTIIGKTGMEVASDSDINIASEEEVMPMPDGGSDLGLANEDDGELGLAEDSDLGLAPAGGSDLSLASDGDSDLNLAAGASDVLAGDSDLLAVADGGSGVGIAATGSGIDLSLDDDATAGTAGSSLALAGSDALSLDDDLKLEGDSAAGSGVGADSSIDLDLDDDDLLAGSGMGSDITLGASDSGINLANPSDSGISLEDVGSGIDSSLESSLELGDDDMIELEADPADPDESTDLQADDEFMLTPVAGDGDIDDESDDSGSQVIALDSDEFDESASTMLVSDDDDPSTASDLLADVGGGALVAGGVAAGAAAAAGSAAMEEADFSLWNIVGLVMLASVMGFCGLLAMDLIRNIWSWNQPFGITNSLMNFLTGM